MHKHCDIMHMHSMDDVEGTLEIIFDEMPAVEDLESELSTAKQ